MQEREREETILRLLAMRKYVHIRDVVESTGASEATLRRDFIRMEKKNQLNRVRGGIEQPKSEFKSFSDTSEPPFFHRININRKQKQRIAQAACSELREGEIIMLDGGTTSYHMVECIPRLRLNIITNSLAIAEYLIKFSNCTVSLPEGNIEPSSLLILNNLHSDPFMNYNASKVYMGIEGITADGLTNSQPQYIQTKLAMIKHSEELIILADETKFGKVCLLTLCGIDKVSRVITTTKTDQKIIKQLRAKGIDVITV